jgi:hypothetical protein
MFGMRSVRLLVGIAPFSRAVAQPRPVSTSPWTSTSDHADSISLSQVQVPRWIAYGGDQMSATLDMLVPALDHLTVAVHLALPTGPSGITSAGVSAT